MRIPNNTVNSGLAVLPAQTSPRAATLTAVMWFNSQCEEGEVCTFFFSVQANGDYPLGSNAQLLMALDWEFHKGVGSTVFDVGQGTTIRIPCNLATARVMYLGAGPGFSVWGARVDDVTNAPPVTFTQRFVVGANGTTPFKPVGTYSKTLRILSTQNPRSNVLSFYASQNVGDLISQETLSDAGDQTIPNGASYFTITNLDGNAQSINAVATLIL